MKNIVIYHKNCTDGTAAAWVAQCFFKNLGLPVEFIDASYDDDVPSIQAANVYILDFSYSADNMSWLIERNKKVVVIDHHESAIQRLSGVVEEYMIDVNSNILVENDAWLLNKEHSGAVLAWQYFFPNLEVPKILLYVEDRDLWLKKMPWTEEVAWLLKSITTIDAFQTLADKFDYDFEGCVNQGKGIKRFVDGQVQQICENQQPFWVNVDTVLSDLFQTDWLSIPSANATYVFSSDVCMELMRQTGQPIALSYFIQNDNTVKFSVRSNKQANGAARRLAEMFGGGGHDNAAGFYLDVKYLQAFLTEPTEEQTGVYSL